MLVLLVLLLKSQMSWTCHVIWYTDEMAAGKAMLSQWVWWISFIWDGVYCEDTIVKMNKSDPKELAFSEQA